MAHGPTPATSATTDGRYRAGWTPRVRVQALLLAVGALLALGGPSLARTQTGEDPPNGLRIRQAELSTDGTSRLVVSVPDDAVDADAANTEVLTVVDGGREIEDPSVTRLAEQSDTALGAVALVMDVSGSTGGAVLPRAVDAATDFVTELTRSGVDVGLVAFNGRVATVAPPTDDTTRLTSALQSLRAGGGTALYDGIVTGVGMLRDVEGVRDIVVFSDGADSKSTHTAAGAIDAAGEIDATVTTVALQTPELDSAALDRLASSTEGTVLPIRNAADLRDGFARVADQLASRYVITYESAAAGDDEVEIAVRLDTGEMDAVDRIITLDRRPSDNPLPTVDTATGGPLAVLRGSGGLYAGVGGVGLAVLLVGGALVIGPSESRGGRVLRRALSVTTRGRKPEAEESTSLLARLAEVVERVPLSEEREQHLQRRLERAGWLWRSSEFRALQVAAALGGLLAGLVLGGGLSVALPLAVVGLVAPLAVLARKATTRARAFEHQLPDLLHLLAGSLRAGYGLLQAVDSVSKEADDPAAGELKRVLTEARLGGSVEHALEAMAARVASEDFRWVVIAINIQRQVGGNLAELLETVATTIREREELRREVKTLSVEGRLSAVILVALPFAIALYTAVVNPDYLSVLTGSLVGRLAIAGAGCLMAVGIVWIRKVIRIQV